MRAPRSLEDTTLLLEEPFASSFTGQEDIAKTALLALFQKTAKKVQAAPGGVRAFPPKSRKICTYTWLIRAARGRGRVAEHGVRSEPARSASLLVARLKGVAHRDLVREVLLVSLLATGRCIS
jgi:hypothetical protein